MRFWILDFRFSIARWKIENGFTLLEVVVAMAIVGLGVVTVIEIFSLGLRLVARSSERASAITYGRQVMDEVLIRRGVQEGGEEGSFGEKHRWRLQVKPLKVESKLLSSTAWELNEITLQMRYQDGEREKQVEMRTLRLVKTKGQ
ncbi:MAG: prepilin-type N-terminal cleavage/methylation domain-containing protein [Deltaproteobacteria bacterium]|nr:prepilin-type N-terminal cleavage/methylation domain-containing protein [Deltaproteobacteria bacterium]